MLSSDGGRSWDREPLSTQADLFAVQALGQGQGVVAVGAGGVVVRVDVNGSRYSVPDVRGFDLFGLHVRDDGSGAAVGAHGTFLTTQDGAEHWYSIDLGVDAPLRGLDQPLRRH